MECRDWLCLVNKALSSTSPDAQETLALLILGLVAVSGVLALLVVLYFLVRQPLAWMWKRHKARQPIEPSPVERALLATQASHGEMILTIRSLVEQNAVQTSAVRMLGEELRTSNELEAKRIAMREADLKHTQDSMTALSETVAVGSVELRRHIDSTVGGLAVQIAPVKAGVDKANSELNKHTAGLNLLDQRLAKANELAMVEQQTLDHMQNAILQRFDLLPAALAKEIKPLIDQWSNIERGVQAIQAELKHAETRVIEAIDRAAGQREALLADLVASAQSLGATKGNGSA